jgi:hypothetical protein
MARQRDDEPLLLQFELGGAELKVVLARGRQRGVGRGRGTERERDRRERDRGVHRQAAELVQLHEGGLDGQPRLGGAFLQRQLLRLDDASLQQRGDAAGLAGEEELAQRLVAGGDFRRGGGALLGGLQAVGERAGAGGERGLEAGEAEFGERDLAVGDGLAQREPARPLEGLRDGDRPGGALAGEDSGGVGDALAAGADGQLGIGEGAGGADPGAGGGQLGLVEGELGILGDDLGGQRRRRRRGRSRAGRRRRGAKGKDVS